MGTRIETTDAMKTCNRCQIEKPLSDFHKRSCSKDGHHSSCKECINAYSKEWSKAHPESRRETEKKYRAASVEQVKERERQYRETHKEQRAAHNKAYRAANKARIHQNRLANRERNRDRIRAVTKAWEEAHKEERRIYRQKYYAANRDRISNYHKAYSRNNRQLFRGYDNLRRERVRRANGHHTIAQIRTLYRQQNGLCAYCQKELRNKYHRDHIEPLSRGGTNGIENIQLLCPACNLAKWAKDPVVFMRERGFLG